MSETLFLFPEKIGPNPSSFLQSALSITNHPFEVKDFKIFAFIDCLDEVDYPFYAAAVRCEGKSAKFYQYKFPEKVPNFEEFGFETFHTENGEVLYLSKKSFSRLSSKYGSISIKSGHWPDVANEYQKLAAYSHIDVIPPLSPSLLRSHDSMEEIDNIFKKLYEPHKRKNVKSSDLTLSSLYLEVVSLLKIFNFTQPNVYTSPDGSSYFFGAIRSAISVFHEKCFSNKLIGNCCLTPASFKQLKGMLLFMRESLSSFGYDPGDDMSTFISTLHRFQFDNGIEKAFCNEITIQTIWKILLSKNTDPISALSHIGVPIRLETGTENENFGDIYVDGSNPASKKIAENLSNIIRALPAPNIAVITAQKHLISAAKSSAEQFRGVNEGLNNLEVKIDNVIKFSDIITEKAENTTKLAKSSTLTLNKLQTINQSIPSQIEAAKKELETELKRMNLLVIILLVVLLLYFIQKHYVSYINIVLSIFKIGFNKVFHSSQRNSLSNETISSKDLNYTINMSNVSDVSNATNTSYANISTNNATNITSNITDNTTITKFIDLHDNTTFTNDTESTNYTNTNNTYNNNTHNDNISNTSSNFNATKINDNFDTSNNSNISTNSTKNNTTNRSSNSSTHQNNSYADSINSSTTNKTNSSINSTKFNDNNNNFSTTNMKNNSNATGKSDNFNNSTNFTNHTDTNTTDHSSSSTNSTNFTNHYTTSKSDNSSTQNNNFSDSDKNNTSSTSKSDNSTN